MDFVRRLILASVLASHLVMGHTVTGDDVVSPTESIVIEQVVRLASPERAVRFEAEQALRDLGPAALPFLPEPETVASPHASEVITRLRLELEQLAAAESLQPTLVRIPANATLGEWTTSMEEQTNYTIVINDEPLASTSIVSAEDIAPMEPITFWQAVDLVEGHVADEMGRTSDGGLVWESRPTVTEVRQHDSHGVVRVSNTSLTEIENLIDPDVNSRFRTRLRLDVEPKLLGLFVHWSPGDIRATVGEVELSPVGADGRRELPIPGSQRIEFPIDFSVPKAEWDRLASSESSFAMSGTVSVTVATGFRKFEFRHLDEPGVVVRRRGGLAATLESFAPSRDQTGANVWEATLVIDYEGQALELDSYQLWVFSHAVSVQREDGTTLLPSGERHVSPAEGGAVRMSFVFADPLSDLDTATLIYEAPTSIVKVPVQFSVGN